MRYFFNVADGQRDPDDDGTELPSIEAAQLEAVRFAGEMLKDHPSKLWQTGQWRVEVTDKRGVLLCTVVTIAIDAPSARQQAGNDLGKLLKKTKEEER